MENERADGQLEMEEEKTIYLRKPLELGKQVYDKLELREPTAGELEKASKAGSDLGMLISLISSIAKVPRLVVERISQRDLTAASDFLGSFTPAAQKTGETS